MKAFSGRNVLLIHILHLPLPFVKPLTEKCLLTPWYRKTTVGIQMWEARDAKTLNWIVLQLLQMYFHKECICKEK